MTAAWLSLVGLGVVFGSAVEDATNELILYKTGKFLLSDPGCRLHAHAHTHTDTQTHTHIHIYIGWHGQVLQMILGLTRRMVHRPKNIPQDQHCHKYDRQKLRLGALTDRLQFDFICSLQLRAYADS